MKDELVEEVSVFLLKNDYFIKGLKSCFDILARKGDKTLLIKVLNDANSVCSDVLNEMKKLACYVGASPMIIAEKAGVKLGDNVVYSRGDVIVVNFLTFKNFISNKPLFVKSNKSGLVVELIGERLKKKRQSRDWSLGYLAKKIGTSARMVVKYEKEDSEISLRRALKLYDIFGGGIFKKIDIFSFVGDYFYEKFSEISRKYHSLGFEAVESKKMPFDVLAKRSNEVILTKVGDKVDEEFCNLSVLLEANNLVIFKKEKPKIRVPSITKEEFLDFEEGGELIKFVKEFESEV